MTRRFKFGLAVLGLVVLAVTESSFGWMRHGAAYLLAARGYRSQALQVYATLASDRDPVALNNYAVLLELDPINFTPGADNAASLGEVRELYKRAAAQGLRAAEGNLALFYASHPTSILESQYDIYGELARQAATGDHLAMLAYGAGLSFKIASPDYPERLKIFKEFADRGVAEAQLAYGDELRTLNDPAADDYYRLAAAQGHFGATIALGYEDLSDQSKRAGGLYWMKKAAEMGNVQMQRALGTIYKSGDGVAVDLTQAVYWLEMAAYRHNERTYGDPWYIIQPGGFRCCAAINGYNETSDGAKSAAYELAELYDEGKGVAPDLVKARELYLMAGHWRDSPTRLKAIEAKLAPPPQ